MWQAQQTKQMGEVLDQLQRAGDPFNSLAVSQYNALFDVKPFVVSKFVDRDFTSGSAVIEVTGSEYRLYNPGGETCRLETAERGRYEPGMVGNPGVAIRKSIEPTGTTKYRWGYFDTTNTDGGGNGFGIEEDANGLRTFVISSGTTVHTRERENWVDPLDGSGPSGYSISTSDGLVFQIPFVWHGYGPIRWCALIIPEDRSKGSFLALLDRYFPESDVSTANPNLPITVEISGDSEGEVYTTGREFGIYGTPTYRRRIVGEIRTSQTVPDTGYVPTIAARLRTIYPWVNVLIQLSAISLQTDSDLYWYIALADSINDTASWNVSQFADVGDTAVEFSTNVSSASGKEIFGGPGIAISGAGNQTGAGSGNLPRLDAPIGSLFVLMAKSQSGSATVTSTMEIAELR
jgi:hypothetical protein